jgi:small subunit ribosomal protein S1
MSETHEGTPPTESAEAPRETAPEAPEATPPAEPAPEAEAAATPEEEPAVETPPSDEPEIGEPTATEPTSAEPPAPPPAAASDEMSDEEAARIAGGAQEAVAPPPPAEGAVETPAVETPDGAAQTGAEPASEEAPLPTDPVSLRLLDALDKGTPIQGKVFGWNQGGYHVLIDGLLAFCPRSEIDLGQPKAPKKYIEKTYRFHVIEHRHQGNRFVVSRSKIVQEERAKQAERTREKLEPGAVLEGRVTSLTNFGAFVDLGGGIEGMVHVSELSHRTVNHPKDAVKKGKTVRVKVLKIEEEGKRISLSIKALEPDPWKEFAEKYPRGTPFAGKITGKTEFGLFVEVETGIEGLIHVSAVAPGTSIEDEAFEPGKEVKGWVKEVEIKRRRISLSMRQVPTSDPWRKVEERYPEGEAVTGTVEEIAPFGVFINLEPGLTGLLPSSEMGLPRGTHAGRVYPPGSEVKVQVSRVEAKRKRITLVPEGAKVEGSRTDFRDFKKKTQETLGSGMPTLAAAFEKLKQGNEE